MKPKTFTTMCYCINPSVHFCNKGCYLERDGFGFLVTTNGASANYSCWPGYTFVKGNLTRTCLATLIWSGRRPTCTLNCTSLITQKCLQCEGESDMHSVCHFDRTSTVDGACIVKLDSATPSVAIVGSNCYEYNCNYVIKGVSSIAADYTARYTCSRGNLSTACPLLAKFTFRLTKF